MFSHLSVSHSVHSREWGVWQTTPWQTPPGRHQLPSRHPLETPPGHTPLGRHPQADSLEQTPPSPGGRYTSYWNVFLSSQANSLDDQPSGRVNECAVYHFFGLEITKIQEIMNTRPTHFVNTETLRTRIFTLLNLSEQFVP